MRKVAVLFVVLCTATAWAGEGELILDETCYLRSYYRFATDRVSPAALKAEGERTLGKVLWDRLQRETQRTMDKSGPDGFAVFRPSGLMLREARRVGSEAALRHAPAAGGADWRDLVFLRMFFDPYTAPAPAADWAGAGFDDSSWVLRRGPFQSDMPEDLPAAKTTGSMANVHVGALQFIGTGMHAAYYRARFVVEDPAAAKDLTLRLTYRGGVRALVNGREVARGHLPKGELAADTPADDYPAAAYDNAALRDRSVGPVRIPADALVKGVNVLAVEVRASDLHPVVLKRERSGSWNALHDREGLWRHGYLARLELRGSGDASGLRRPAGTQVWVADIHHRTDSTELLPPGESGAKVRIVGARGGVYGAQIVVGTDKDLAGLRVTPGEMKGPGGVALAGSAMRVFYMVPYPASEFGDKFGDERGLGARFPDARTLAEYETVRDASKAYVFDRLGSAAPDRVPANTCRAAWLSLRIPSDAAAGLYRGSVEVRGDGMAAVQVPVEVAVMGWRLPQPSKFQTFVGCEENPYAVAKQYGVRLWSDEHFKLLKASLAQLGRAGGTLLNVPVLRGTEFGNRDDSMIGWTRKADGTLAFDYTVLDRYLDLAVGEMGVPRVIDFVVMYGMKGQWGVVPEVNVRDGSGRVTPMPMSVTGAGRAEAEKAWTSFGRSLAAHLRAKGLEKSLHFGYPLDSEAEPELRALLVKTLPQAGWIAGPHQLGWQPFNGPEYKFLGSVRYFGRQQFAGFRMDNGWKAAVGHLTIPRIDSSVLSLHTASHPFAFRTLVSHSLGLGRVGFCRVGVDEWAAAHYDGMRVQQWITGIPVLFTLWPGPEGAESSARMEALLEGVQEGEARIALEQALDRRRIAGGAESRVRDILSSHFNETGFFQNKLCIFELEQYHYRWQERSWDLYAAAAVAGGGAAPTAEERAGFFGNR